MAGMLPNKKSPSEIEREFDELREAHRKSVDEWLNSRLESNRTALRSTTSSDAEERHQMACD